MSTAVPSDLAIARAAHLLPIEQVAQAYGIPLEDLEPYGRNKAKLSLDLFRRLQDRPLGKLILVTAITPTPAGEGKTTTTIGLADALNLLGHRTAVCIREPSLGPCFGVKGGAAGGGHAQVVPMEDINLHFTGDFHAIGAAHNLLSACLDNHLTHGNALGIDPTRVVWKRVVDMNDRALRQIVIGLGGTANGQPRESGFDITVASEVMAVLCLSETLMELKERLGRMIVAYTYDRKPVTASRLKVHGAMAVLLKEAIKPNLVQTLENNPAFVHGGPFANIAHGCNSVIATKLALRLGEFTVTEAGFGADLGAEKFLNIKCRQAGLAPEAAVLVATVRALKMHGGVAKDALVRPDAAAVGRGLPNLLKHLENLKAWGLPVVVAVNAFTSDTPEEVAVIVEACAAVGVKAVLATHWAEGSRGAVALAQEVLALTQGPKATLQFTYPDGLSLWEKVRAVARGVYGADDVKADAKVRKKFQELEDRGHGHLPVCLAKTQYSFSTDPALRGRPSHFDLPIRDVAVSAGAGFVVVLTGGVMTMPGLPTVPAAELIDIDDQGHIVGLS
jgi:formate--tetrahydrofolate ligase